MSEDDRRRHARLPREAVTTCQPITYPLGSEPETEIRMLDVSEGGVRFASHKPFAVGAPLQVALKLQGWHRHTTGFLKYDQTDLSEPLTAVGRVTRSEALPGGAYEIGVQFVDIWEDHWRAMRSFLRNELEAGRD
ncbi:MAG: PilZ domain-containing protein [Thermodesulfobacteriota bacterium]|jgi:hypothetical protein